MKIDQVDKKVWGLLSVGLILLVGGFYLYGNGSGKALPSESVERVFVDQEEDWQDYSNSEEGLFFRYPPKWELEVIEGAPFFSANLTFEDSEQEAIAIYGQEMIPTYVIAVSVEDSQTGTSAEEHYLANFGVSSRERVRESLEKVTYCGYQGIQYEEGAGGASGKSIGVLFAQGGKLYRFVYSATATADTHTKYLGTFEDLLSTISLGK